MGGKGLWEGTDPAHFEGLGFEQLLLLYFVVCDVWCSRIIFIGETNLPVDTPEMAYGSRQTANSLKLLERMGDKKLLKNLRIAVFSVWMSSFAGRECCMVE